MHGSKRAVVLVCHVIASLGEQTGKHDIGRNFINKAKQLVDSYQEHMGSCLIKSMSSTITLLSLLVDLVMVEEPATCITCITEI